MDMSLLKSDGRAANLFSTLKSDGSALRFAPNESRALGTSGIGGANFGVGASLPAPVLSGVAVTPETSLTFPAVFACIMVLSTDLASIPFEVKRKLRTGGKVPVPGDRRYNLTYCEPNKNCTAQRFFTSLYGHRFGWGNGYGEIKRDYSGMPTEVLLHSPRPSDTWPEKSKSGALWYQVDSGRRQVRGEDMVHLAGFGFNGLTGYSPIALHRQGIGYGMALEQHGAAFFGNASVPKGALKVQKKLSPEAKKNLRESFDSVHQGSQNAHRMMVLEEGMEWQGFSISNQDAEYILSRQFQVVEICRIFRVPPPIIMDFLGISGVYKAFGDTIQHYVQFSLRPEVRSTEQEFDRKFFTTRERAHGLHTRHDMKELMRGNTSERLAYLKGRFETGSITPDEIREMEGDNPSSDPNSKRFYINKGYVPLDMVGQVASGVKAGDPLAEEVIGVDNRAARRRRRTHVDR